MPGRKYANYPEDLDDNSKKIKIGKCKVDNALVDTILIIDVLTRKILDALLLFNQLIKDVIFSTLKIIWFFIKIN